MEEIIELFYNVEENSLVLFKCRWFDPVRGVSKNKNTGVVQIKKDSILRGDDVFMFASQCSQVCYIDIPSKDRSSCRYLSVVYTKARGRIDFPISNNRTQQEDEVLQMDEMSTYVDNLQTVDVEETGFVAAHSGYDAIDEQEAIMLGNYIGYDEGDDEHEDEENEDDEFFGEIGSDGEESDREFGDDI